MFSDAYDLYSALWIKLVKLDIQKDVGDEILSCRTDNEIIKYVRHLLNSSKLQDSIELNGDCKNDVKAIACRKKGNEYFHPNVKQYIKAIERYNESIALAETNSETLAIAYANRSAVCFELKEYSECLENIELARQNGYPSRLMAKLAKREADCLSNLNDPSKQHPGQSKQREVKLSYKPNPNAPHISDCLELMENEQFGRYIVTNRNLSAGDVVIVEKPFSRLLVADLRYLNCDYCHKDSFLTLIPCRNCSVTMFCSEKCSENADKSYHRIECPIINDMYKLFTKVILMALRTTTVAIRTFDSNLEELRLHIESIDELSLNPFQLNWNAIDPKEIYSTIHILATNQKLRTPSDLIQRSIYAIIMSDQLCSKTELSKLCEDNQSNRDLIESLIFRHAQTAPVNMHSLMYMNYCPEAYEQYQCEFLGCGSFPILSMINHSCAPNVVRLTVSDGAVVAFLNRPIAKGGQLFDNYGYHHCLETLQERQSGLLAQYYFKCQCEACRKNYALYYDLPTVKIPTKTKHPINFDELELLRKHDMETALKKIPQYCRFLNTFDSNYPNHELSSVQEALLRCYQIVFSTQSRKLKYRNLCSL
ncbi:SET and MYND domain-containing protein 4 [Toxorhynchites rutilus septentrionalis]|uniref:SET and MYND domain-containing protein 4 n=1 Tax=Toxorhynchites rutilus septentrionalis TaxID=329112 RepID=UPI002478AEF6|nr:SET and MYND domain-containing protein 4 [Toxorhynchites rutilus septentrionalis]